MDTITKNYLTDLHNSCGADNLVLWHLKGLTRLVLRSFWCDLNYIRDIGVSEYDQKLVMESLSNVTKNLLKNIDIKISGGFVRHLNDIPNFLDGWAKHVNSNYNIAHWNLNRIQVAQKRLSKLSTKNNRISEELQIDDIVDSLKVFGNLAERSPSTFYQLGKVFNELSELSNISALRCLKPGFKIITKIVSATIPLYRLLKRDIEAIYRMDAGAFEDFVRERLEQMGMDVHQTGKTYTSDGGVDFIATPRNSIFPFLLAVQVKHHRHPDIKTGPGPIKDMQSVLAALPFHAGMIVTNTFFTPDAEWWASQSPGKLQLHDISSIRNWIEGRYGLDRFKNIPPRIQLTPRLEVGIW